MDKPKIGFIGLGLMGSAMVERLQALDYPVTVLAHRNRTPIDAAVARGAHEAATTADLAAGADIVMICVDTSASVESVMEGADGVIENLRPGSVVIDFGTSLPGSTRRLNDAVTARQGAMLDAPLGRTPAHARDGLLNIMAAGAEPTFTRMKPVLNDLGENVFHVGPIGAGHTLKLINNFFAQTTACSMSEAFAMADRADLDRSILYEVMSSGPLKSGMMDFIKTYAIDGIPDALAFSITNAAKDLGYYAGMAEEAGAPSLLAAGTRTVLENAKSQGMGDKMVPEMVDYFAGESGSEG